MTSIEDDNVRLNSEMMELKDMHLDEYEIFEKEYYEEKELR